jgi:hypothetical protein
LAGVTSPNDPPPYQPYGQSGHPQPGSEQPGQHPGYQQPGYPQSGYPGYQQPGYQQPGYQQPSYPQWPGQYDSAESGAPMRRPAVLIAAGVIWLLIALFMVAFGIFTAVADQIPGFNEAMRQQGITITSEQLRTFGFLLISFGVLIGALGILVFRGSLWARIAVLAAALMPALVLVQTYFFPLLVITAGVLQFLPAANAYAQQRRRSYR